MYVYVYIYIYTNAKVVSLNLSWRKRRMILSCCILANNQPASQMASHSPATSHPHILQSYLVPFTVLAS